MTGSPYVTIDPAQAAALMPELTFTIDWAEMGRLFAKQASPEQAEFLVAFFEAAPDVQLAYIASERIFSEGDPRAEKADFFATLAEFIGESEQRPYSEAVDIELGAWETEDIAERARDLLAVVARRIKENR